MSVVSGITLIVSICEEQRISFDDFLTKAACLKLPEFRDISDEAAGPKHPQFMIYCLGINYLPQETEQALILAFLESEWQCPENAILVIQPEDGETSIYRPKY